MRYFYKKWAVVLIALGFVFASGVYAQTQLVDDSEVLGSVRRQISTLQSVLDALLAIQNDSSAQVVAQQTIILQAPTSLTAQATSRTQINISWVDSNSNETGYLLERSLSSTYGFIRVATLRKNRTSYINSSLAGATTYYYRARAYRTQGGVTTYSPYSSVASATTFAYGNILVKRVGSDEYATSAPPGTTARVDDGGALNTNPSSFSSISVGAHTAYATDVNGFAESAGACVYVFGAAECTVTNFDIVPACDGVSCGAPIT